MTFITRKWSAGKQLYTHLDVGRIRLTQLVWNNETKGWSNDWRGRPVFLGASVCVSKDMAQYIMAKQNRTSDNQAIMCGEADYYQSNFSTVINKFQSHVDLCFDFWVLLCTKYYQNKKTVSVVSNMNMNCGHDSKKLLVLSHSQYYDHDKHFHLNIYKWIMDQ